jgi:hypothetical protein
VLLTRSRPRHLKHAETILMRDCLALQTDWHVSPSPADAARAACGAWVPAELEYADDPENHPRRIALPGGPQYGKRPRGGAATRVLPADAAFVGLAPAASDGSRLPSPFLSYARRVRIPQEWAGQRVHLLLDNVRYHVTVHVDGTTVGQYVGGLEPHRMDITGAVTPGTDALLLITVGDSGVSGHRRFDPYRFTGTRLPTCKEIESNLVHPVNYGGADRAVGQVSLAALPPLRVEHVFADPKVSRGLLRLTLALANDTDAAATVRLRSEAVGARPLVDAVVDVPARGTTRLVREIPWPDAVLWDLDNPHLYELRTTLAAAADGTPLDTHADSFGFREFTINGHSFYLNGTKIHLHGQSGHTSPDQDTQSLEEKMAFLRAWKEQGNVVHVRLHAKPQHRDWVRAADRVGMLVTTETALWTTGFHSFDWAGSEEACYENVRQHFLEALVRRDRNSPSVVIWSLSNEMSPITPFDLDNPKMAAMTRVFERILAETAAEDSSRVVQMSSAMDFLGRLRMYNLHYPKNWQAFPDYPHTAYWLDGSFLFPWYGPRRQELPSWGWRKDKPLYFGEFTCVFGATPDNQASIVGDIAFEEPDFGTERVNEKLWPLEIHAYRRLDVSGFCAWACMFAGHSSRYDVAALLRKPYVAAHTRALRPVAVLAHTYRTDYFARDEIAIELSLHNDTRHDLELTLDCELRSGGRVLWREHMPARRFGPAESLAFTSRCRAPAVARRTPLRYRAVLRSGRRVLDRWDRPVVVWPEAARLRLPPTFVVYDPDGELAARCAARGLSGARFARSLAELQGLRGIRTLWLPFHQGHIHLAEWQTLRRWVEHFVHAGGVVILDHAPDALLPTLPVAVRNGRGYAAGERLEITYAYNVAPQHPVVAGFTDADLSLWGRDYYLARRTYETPQEGNAVPLLVAGTDRAGLTTSPLLELRHGDGRLILSSLEIFEKLRETPVAARLLRALAAYRPAPAPAHAAVCVGADTARILREVGAELDSLGAASATAALAAPVSLVDGECLRPEDGPALRAALAAGHAVCLHALSVEQTRTLLRDLDLPGTVLPGTAAKDEFDTFRHTHALANGMTNNYLYWIVNKAKVAPWTRAPLHPEPASARVQLAAGADACSLTRRGAVLVYAVGPGTLVLDNLRWHLPEFDEPERPRRYLCRLLTNLGIPLTHGVVQRLGQEFETEAERRERGHF